MKKAKIILACAVLFAIASGVLAFNVSKFVKGTRAYSWTDLTSSTVGGFIYTATGSFCVTPNSLWFINTIDNVGMLTDTYSTTTPSLVVTLTHVPGGQTITRAIIGCQFIQQTIITPNV
jgi:hypothetical protein